MAKKNNLLNIAVTRSGGIMAHKLDLKDGLFMTEADWDELKLLNSEGGRKLKPDRDGFLYKFSFSHDTVVLAEEDLPIKWKGKLQSIDF